MTLKNNILNKEKLGRKRNIVEVTGHANNLRKQNTASRNTKRVLENRVPKRYSRRAQESVSMSEVPCENEVKPKFSVSHDVELPSHLAMAQLSYSYEDEGLPYILYLLQLADEDDFFEIAPAVSNHSSISSLDVSSFVTYLTAPAATEGKVSTQSDNSDMGSLEETHANTVDDALRSSDGIEVEVL